MCVGVRVLQRPAPYVQENLKRWGRKGEHGTKPYGSLNRGKFWWTQHLPVAQVISSTMKEEIKLL